jgi:hypothetical protein
MNPFDFVRADGGSLAPVVIFIIWLIFSLIGGAQKKKKKQMLEEQRRREAASRPEPVQIEEPEPEPEAAQPRYQGSGAPEDAFGEIKRELETMLGNQREEEEYTPSERESAPLDTESVSYQNYDAVPAPSSAPLETTEPVFTPLVGSVATPSPIASYSYEESAATAHEPAGPAILDLASLNEARKGMLWSEVLGPCKALRDE